MKLYEKMNSGVYVIAEMSANHAGKIENAFKIIEEAAKAGADCVKIQTYTADTLTIDCREEPYQIKGGLWDARSVHPPLRGDRARCNSHCFGPRRGWRKARPA